jgi:hypothetical protein
VWSTGWFVPYYETVICTMVFLVYNDRRKRGHYENTGY